MIDDLPQSLSGTSDERPIGTAGPRRRDVLQAWRRGTERMQESRAAILDARDLEDGTLVLASPDATLNPDGSLASDPHSSRLPHRWQLPSHLEQQVADLMPDILREPKGGSEQADAQAQKVEAWLRGALEQHLPWRDGVGKAVRDSEWAAYLLPASAVWEKLPTWMDAQGAAIRREWWRDAKGNHTDVAADIDTGRSAKAYREAWEAAARRRLPAVHRLVSATDCVPFFTRGYGKRRWELSSLIVRTLHDPEALLADGFTWDGQDSMLLPTGYTPDSVSGQYDMVYLYEWFYSAVGKDGWSKVPMVAYYVAGKSTQNRRMAPADEQDAPVDAVVNLADRYGLTRHLMGYYWGFQRAGEDNPAHKGIPYLTPWTDTILGAERMRAATRKHAEETAFRGYQFVPNPDIPKEAYTLGTDGARTMRQFPLPGSGEGVSVPGQWLPVAPAPMGDAVRYMIETDLGILSATAPNPQQFGAGDEGAGSGRELSVSHALFQTANSHVKEGLRQWVEDVAEWELELHCALIRTFKLDGIAVTSNQPTTADATTARRTAPRDVFTLTPGMVGENYEVTAFYPKVGNLADVAQEIAAAKEGYSTFDRVMELKGVNDPFTERVKIAADRYLLTPQGELLQQIYLSRYRGDEEAAQKLIEQLQMAEDGTPAAEISPEAMTAAQQAVGEQMGAGGGMAMGAPPGAAALGGVVNGALQAGNELQDAQMTSDIVQAPPARIGGV